MYELIYTSVPRGLIPGRSGFCTVAMTEGMPPNLVVPLENLSGYNFNYIDGLLPPALNPACCYYIKMRYGNQHLHVAGRVAPNGLDYSQRNNKIAHHILFESAEEMKNLSGGVAGLFLKGGVFNEGYTGEPALLPFRKVPLCLQRGGLPARKWAELAGHAGFAAMAAEQFKNSPDRPLYLIYPAGTSTNDLLELVMEVCALLNDHVRNYFTFSTYFGSGNASADCFLRMVPEFSPLVNNLRRFHRSEIIELGQDNELPDMVDDEALYEYACTGKPPVRVMPNDDQTLSHNTIRIITDSTLPRTQKIVLPEPEDDTAITIPPPQENRKFIFIAVAAAIILAIAGLFIFVLSGKNNEREGTKQEISFTEKTPVPPEKTAPNSGKAPAVNDDKATVNKDNGADAVPIRESYTPLKSTANTAAAVKKITLFGNPRALKQARSVSTNDALLIFSRFQKLAADNSSARVLELPPALHQADEVYMIFSKLGTAAVNSSGFIRKLDHDCGVGAVAAKPGTLPLQPYKGILSDIPHWAIYMDSNRKNLRFELVNPMPDALLLELKNIEAIYWRTPRGILKWENTFAEKLLKAVKPGKFIIHPDGALSYTPGETEKNLYHFMHLKFGNTAAATFLSGAFDFESFNNISARIRKLKQTNEALNKQIKKTLLHQTLPGKKDYEAALDELQKAVQVKASKSAVPLMNQLLARQFAPGDREVVSCDELRNIANDISGKLVDMARTETEEQALASHLPRWQKQISRLEEFRKMKKELADNKTKLSDLHNQLISYAQMNLNKVKSVDPKLENLLKGLMAGGKGKSFEDHPGTIDARDIAILTGAIAKRLHFERTQADGE